MYLYELYDGYLHIKIIYINIMNIICIYILLCMYDSEHSNLVKHKRSTQMTMLMVIISLCHVRAIITLVKISIYNIIYTHTHTNGKSVKRIL